MKLPNLVIFRIPDEDGEKRFAELELGNSSLRPIGKIFETRDPADTYQQMEFYHIVLAESVSGGSIDLERFSIMNTDTGEMTNIHELPFDELDKIVNRLVDAYMIYE